MGPVSRSNILVVLLSLFFVLGFVCQLEASPFNTYAIHDFFRLSLYSKESLDQRDHFLTNCSTDTIVNLYLKDFTKGQWQCHLSDCLHRNPSLKTSFIQLTESASLQFLVAPFLDLVFNQPNCPELLSNAFAGVEDYLKEAPNTRVEVRVVETHDRLDQWGNGPECSREQRIIVNVVVPDYCNSSCLSFCYNEFVSYPHLHRAIAAFELRNLKKSVQATIKKLQEEKDLVLHSFIKDASAFPFIDQAADHREFEDCVVEYTSYMSGFYDQRILIP